MTNYIAKIVNHLELVASRGYDISRVFSEWLDLMVYALQSVSTEEEHLEREKNYLQIINRFKNALPKGQREADHFAFALSLLMQGMQETNEELLGEIYERLALNYNGFGQFFTPKAICQLLAKINFANCAKISPLIADPCAGSGRMLIEAFKLKPEGFYLAQDIDFRCVKICALNFLFFNIDGMIIWGDSLALEAKMAYRTIRNPFGGQLFLITQDSDQWIHVQQFVPGITDQIPVVGGE